MSKFCNLAINIVLFWDIYFILVNPFKPRRKRFHAYFLFISIIMIVVIRTTEIQRNLSFFPKNDERGAAIVR
jgi:hypothetical protein